MMCFPDIKQIVCHVNNDYEKSFIEEELRDGLEYYINRVDLLGFSGDRVLDAGCGIGQWSCALSKRFKHVDAIDLNDSRLQTLRNIISYMGIDNISTDKSSIEKLPFDSETFDCIFCYGVIMFTDVQGVLNEFSRIIKPKGKLYVCLNSDGWNKYLAFERSKKNPKMREVGQNVLYATYLSRALKGGLFYKHETMESRKLNLGLYNNLETCIKNDLDLRYREYLKEDIKTLGSGLIPTCLKDPTRAYMPDEIKAMTAIAGFENFLFAPEGQLHIRELNVKVKAKYESYYMNELTVWEFLCDKC